jgi:hypothetical protein
MDGEETENVVEGQLNGIKRLSTSSASSSPIDVGASNVGAS